MFIKFQCLFFEMKVRFLSLSAVLTFWGWQQEALCMPGGSSEASELSTGMMKRQFLDAESLRGYGEVSGVAYESNDGCVLEITCEDEAHARLTQSKYLSDLDVLPGVAVEEVSVDGIQAALRHAEGQGWIAALQSENRVVIISASELNSLKALIADIAAGSPGLWSGVSRATVPMWLDRWDRYGFRFYYRPWELPKGESLTTYDFAEEFSFAEQSDHAGIIHWANFNDIDTAAGLTNEVWWNWSSDGAVDKGLPVGLNIMTGGTGKSSFFNVFRDQAASHMPQFSGGFHRVASPYLGGNGMLSWGATDAKDAELAVLQQMVETYASKPNLVTVLEPHGEIRHGVHNFFLEYGPVADASYVKFLQERYASVEQLNDAWGTNYTSWSQVRVPEIASFLGWGDEALDLSGDWRIQHEAFIEGDSYTEEELETRMRTKVVPTQGAPEEWFTETFDDSSWPVVTAPGHDRTLFLPHRPAVYRRSFDVNQDWLTAHPKAWLYVWDMNFGTHDKVQVVLNGQPVSETKVLHVTPHWVAVEVGSLLRPTDNQLSIRLPKGYLAYRVYLSPDEPLQYPDLGPGLNAQWVDFIDWNADIRVDMVRRGMEMIRQAAPNQQIVLMAPDYYADGIKEMAKQYGGNFHNTGYMGVFYADYLPSLMRGANMPFSLEPGSPAPDLQDFKKKLGLYSTEGLQGLDYYIHIGSVMWDPKIRNYFQDNLPLVDLIGKYHSPRAEVAALYATRSTGYTGYPWGQDSNTNLASGYWKWNVRAYLDDRYESDGLTESSFADGDADRYKVIIDTNTSIMDEALLQAIEEYVREGGTFVTFVQTGRHTPTKPDTWPISQLTGFRVASIDAYDDEGSPLKEHGLHPAPNQSVFTGDWSAYRANGLFLEQVALDAHPLMLWDDGQVAIGMRKLGRGAIVQVGCKFTGRQMADRIEPPRGVQRPTYDNIPESTQALKKLFGQLLQWKDIEPIPVQWTPENGNVRLRHFLSNNGLYDVWVAWNQSVSESANGTIAWSKSVAVPSWAIDVRSANQETIEHGSIPVTLEPLAIQAFLTPRDELCQAPLAWFELQRSWWQAPNLQSSKRLTAHTFDNVMDLSQGWAFKALEENDNAKEYIQPDADVSDWSQADMGIWSLGEHKGVKRALLRKTFTVPADWKSGEATFWLQSQTEPTFLDRARVWMDGKLVVDWKERGINNLNPDGALKPGSRHTVAVEIEGKGSLVGSRGAAWLWFWEKPESAIDLAGTWTSSKDALRYDGEVEIPGRYKAMTLRRTVFIPESARGSDVYLSVEDTGRLVGVLVNGHWVRRYHHYVGSKYELNITPWIKFDSQNEIELASMDGVSQGRLDLVRLDLRETESSRTSTPYSYKE